MKTERSCVETCRQVKDVLQKTAAEDASEKRDESKYVDLELVDVDAGGEKPEKVCGFGERNQLSILTKNGGAGAVRATEPSQSKHESAIQTEMDSKKQEVRIDVKESPSDTSLVPLLSKPEGCVKSGDKVERAITQPDVSKTKDDKYAQEEEEEEVHCGNHYLSERSVSDDYDDDDDDDSVSLVLSDDCLTCVTEDESHYITTHEIQLSELSDHEADCDVGVASSSSWDIEDDNQVYSFVDYASFEGDGAVGEKGAGRQPRSLGAAATVSNLLESDLCNMAKFTGSDESVSKPQQCSGNSAGQIHLSIRTTSRAINDPSNIQEQENIFYHARRSGDMSRYVFRGVDGKAEALCDRAKCFIAAPGRLHFGGKLRGKEVTEYSSGTSSAVSELDDADKEVRNLTARAFKSLAYPYFNAINFSTSSESSASERGIGINRWSTFVDLKYGNMNMSQGLDQSVVSHQNSTTSFEIAKNIENKCYKGIALESIKPPTSKIFTLNGNPHSASSKKIELMGKFGQGHGGVIRLTETLNFRCNVKSGMSGEERRTNFAQNAAGSRSTDEVTNSLLRGQRREATKAPSKSMEDTHKKAIFASSLIKNVISKKMQFEQERKMERGEISEPHNAPSPCFTHQEGDGYRGRAGRELQRQSSKFSESGSDHAITCLDELGDIVDSGSCDTKSDSRRQDTNAPGLETNLESANEAGINAKKGALEASKSTLLRSQNSAFRCWKDEELEFQKDHKNDKTLGEKLQAAANDKEREGAQYPAGNSKLTKMSHLFVPSIQLLSSDGETGQQGHCSHCGDGGGIKLRSDNTLYIKDSSHMSTSKSPEIKINLRSMKDNKTVPFGVSKLRAPNIGRTDDFKCHALSATLKGECSDKVPHFMVRDIRDNKGKLQTPIHQVRDVRKLVKSSYHFVSLDNNDSKSSFVCSDSHSEQKKSHRNPNSVSPIVIKCQSVNTNNNGKQSGDPDLIKQGLFDTDRSSPEGAKSTALQKASGRAATEESTGFQIESRVASNKQEKIPDGVISDKKSKMANQVALEKLQAAVKTMEQLYVFEKNEWKRKNEPQRMTDSHVLSMIANEAHEALEEEGGKGDCYPIMEKTPPAVSPNTDNPFKFFQTSGGRDDRQAVKSVQPPSNAGGKNMFDLKTANTNTQPPFNTKSFVPKSPNVPVSKQSWNEGVDLKKVDRFVQEFSMADNENYLTIPVKSHLSNNKQPQSVDKSSVYTSGSKTSPTTPPLHLSQRNQEDLNQNPKPSSTVMGTCSPEIPSATIYHSLPLGLTANQPQVYCFSPAITPAPTLDPFQATQRKMLLDPTTGNYYLVDTPVQPASKRLFDPETGQYVDVPMPQPPMTPVPMSISPLSLSPGAYGHTYMIYPGFMPAPTVIPARSLVQSQMSVQSEPETVEKGSSQQAEGLYMESPFYMTTGKCPQMASGVQQAAATNRTPHSFSSIKQPVISITSQQGPRIIAPPSFDGTTMSFVVEHR